MRKILFISLVIMLVGVILTSTFFIYKDKKEDKKQEEVFEELEVIANNEYNTEQETKGEKKGKQEETINIEELYKINNDIVGWIKIDDTNVSYPVMQTKERPNYYLNRNFYKKYSALGTPYLAESCNIKTSDNLIIYGHHIKRKKSFWRVREL